MSIVKMQVPIEKSTRDKLKKRAEGLGFDSVQAYIRVWAKAETDGRDLNFGDDWGEPSPAALARWDKQTANIEKERKAGTLDTFNSVEELMRDL